MDQDHTEKLASSEGATDSGANGELGEEQLEAVSGGTAIAVGVKRQGAKQSVEQAQTMTAIALAESGGNTGA